MTPESRLNQGHPYLPFAICLLLLLLMLWDGLSSGFQGVAELITLIPAGVMAIMAWGLLVSRADSFAACVLSVYLMALAVLARDSLTGLHTFPLALVRDMPIDGSAFHIPELVWALALGASPLVYARQLIQRRDSPFSLMRSLGLFLAALGFILAQALTVFVASRYAPASPLFLPVLRLPATGHHLLLLYSAPLISVAHIVAVVLLNRPIRERRDQQALASFWIVLAGGFYLLLSGFNLLIQNRSLGIATLLVAYAVPVISLYAFEHYALFDIRLTLRRIVQYSLARSTLTLMTLAPLMVAAFFLGNGFEWEKMGYGGTFLVPRHVNSLSIVSSILLTVLSGTLLAVRTPLLNWLDRTYFREVYDAQRVLNRMTRQLIRPTSLTDIGQNALQGIVAALHPKSALLVMRDKDEIAVLAAHNVSTSAKLADESLLDGTLPVAYPPNQNEADDVIAFQNALSFNARQLLTEADIRLIMPIREEGVAAVMLLGAKVAGTDYSPEDLEMLSALAPQIALGLQNMILTRDTLQNRTLEMNQRSAGFVELVERERRLFAADLHDQTLPELRSLLTDLHTLQTEHQEHAPDLPDMEDRLKQAIENIRDMMESLRPSALEILGLMPALENELRKSAARARPPLIPQFFAESHAANVAFPNFTEVLIFRVMQEAVNNACRHAKAHHLRVIIETEGSLWRLRVEDDGVGLPSAETRRIGNGLGNMQFRATLIGATLQWTVPEHGIGTRVELSLPLPQ